MSRSIFLLYSLSRRRVSDSVRSFFFIPTGLALATSLFILFYISSTSHLFNPYPHHQFRLHFLQNPVGVLPKNQNSKSPIESQRLKSHDLDFLSRDLGVIEQNGGDAKPPPSSNGSIVNGSDVFHDRAIFTQDYNEMKKHFKIYMYPHKKDDPFANVLAPITSQPQGNYASESYFKRTLNRSHFLTKNPSEADLFYLPFSITRLRHDPRVGAHRIQDFIRDYILNVSRKYPYWNRTGGADHFYVACHSVGRSAIQKVQEVKVNAIQVVCSSSYFQASYVPHKDASLPQIWPRVEEDPPHIRSSERKKLAFFAGTINSPVRVKLVKSWQNDSQISIHHGRLKSPYGEALLGSKFCLHVKGFEVNTARVGDSLYYGCVPVILANHYDLPFADVLNWKSFAIIVATLDIPSLRNILRSVSTDDYNKLQNNVFHVREHFRWHVRRPVDYDAFYMVMYELWLRRSSVRVPLS